MLKINYSTNKILPEDEKEKNKKDGLKCSTSEHNIKQNKQNIKKSHKIQIIHSLYSRVFFDSSKILINLKNNDKAQIDKTFRKNHKVKNTLKLDKNHQIQEFNIKKNAPLIYQNYNDLSNRNCLKATNNSTEINMLIDDTNDLSNIYYLNEKDENKLNNKKVTFLKVDENNLILNLDMPSLSNDSLNHIYNKNFDKKKLATSFNKHLPYTLQKSLEQSKNSLLFPKTNREKIKKKWGHIEILEKDIENNSIEKNKLNINKPTPMNKRNIKRNLINKTNNDIDIKSNKKIMNEKIGIEKTQNKEIINLNNNLEIQKNRIGYLSPLQKNIQKIISKIKKTNKINYDKYFTHNSNLVLTSTEKKNEKRKAKNLNFFVNNKNNKLIRKINNSCSKVESKELRTKKILFKHYKNINSSNVIPIEERMKYNTNSDFYKTYIDKLKEKKNKEKEFNSIDFSYEGQTNTPKFKLNQINKTKRSNKIENIFDKKKTIVKMTFQELLHRDQKSRKINIKKNINNKSTDEETVSYKIKKVPIFNCANFLPKKLRKNTQKLTLVYSNKLNFCQFVIQILNDEKLQQYILLFLDNKSLINFALINKDFHKNIGYLMYNNIYNKMFIQYNNRLIINDEFIMYINKNLIKKNFIRLKLKNNTQIKKLYESISTKSTYDDLITKDLLRTFPEDKNLETNSKYYKKLYNLLTKYSNYNPEIGYAQGLNFLFASALYFFENEIDAFFYMDGFIYNFKLEKFFATKNNNLPDEIKIFAKILCKYIPDIVKFLESKLLNHEFFSTGWILTLFSNSVENKNLMVLWSFMIIFGWKFFYSIVIQILIFYESTILKADINKLSFLMKNLLKGEKFNEDLQKIIKDTMNFMHANINLL